MFKLIKYELRSTFLTILGICITVIIANLLLMTKKGSWDVAVVTGIICMLSYWSHNSNIYIFIKNYEQIFAWRGRLPIIYPSTIRCINNNLKAYNCFNSNINCCFCIPFNVLFDYTRRSKFKFF